MILRALGRSQAGNVFFAIFGAVALVGVLTAGVATFVKGPLATSVKITRQNTAENQMSIAGQVAVMAAANAPGGGDCDGDGFVEPLEWREDITKPFPTGGGLIPMSIGISKKDPWGTEYGYCVWDHGAATNGAGSCGGPTQKRLAGHNSKIYPVVALVSAGPDKVFTTTCRTFADADVNGNDNLEDAGVDLPLIGKANSNDDDVIFTYTYEEATGASGGLWSLKSGDPDTAVIDKKIESTGVGSFRGGVLLPDSSLITCDPTTAGIMARSASGNGIQICDGTGWEEISGGVSTPYGVGLVIDPNTSSGMNITAPCGNSTCYSTNVTFAVVNKLQPPVASDVLTVTLTNTANFEKVSDNCNGQSIGPGDNCQITVRAKAMGDIGYTGILRITGNNSPFANLDGVSTGFGCNIGGDAPGGKFAACNVGGYNLITTPSGCTSSPNNPTCAGGPDTFMATFTPASVTAFSPPCCTSTSGAQQTADYNAYTGGMYTFPAANWCSNLQYGGYDDWFLPTHGEMTNLLVGKALLGSAASGTYWVSNNACDWGNSKFYNLDIVSGSNGGCGSTSVGTANKYVRCMRWDPARPATPTPDTTVFPVAFVPSSGSIAGESRLSNVVTIYGITQPVAFSITGGTAAQYSKNGGGYTSSATTVTSGDTITLRATSPVPGQQDMISVTIGTSSYGWRVRTVANNTIYAFVTSATAQGNVGLGGADNMCASAATTAGLAGTWTAILATAAGTGGGPVNRVPWNWTLLKNMNNDVVATSFADLTDGSWSAPINRTAANTVSSATYAWTGAVDNNGLNGYSNFDGDICGVWGTTSYSTRFANIQSGTQGFGGYGGGCNLSLPVICMQDPGGALVDTNPADVSITPGIAYSANAVALSNTVTVTSILQPVTVSITPSAGTANIIKNGVSQGSATTMANPNDTIQFSLTVPTTIGQKNTATLVLGDDTYNWWVGYADSAKETRFFVTSTQYQGNLGGLTGADNICMTRAAASPFGLGGRWKAILSDTLTPAAGRIPWNWGIMKNVQGGVLADGGYNDMWDGSLDSAPNVNEMGGITNTIIASNTAANGSVYSTNQMAHTCNGWTTNTSDWSYGSWSGNSVAVNNTWIAETSGNRNCQFSYSLYCIEDVDDLTDTTPNNILVPYAVQVTPSSRQTSVAVLVSGMSSGVSQTLSVTATGGTPRFKINGGAEVSSGSIKNGDSLVFVMDAPAGAGASNRMTLTASTMTSYWRVWSGDPTGSVVKRAFIVDKPSWNGGMGGVSGADTVCSSAASAAALGGTWKALLSGQAEPEWAINRIGYNWSTLRGTNGADIVMAGNIWNTASVPLLSPIVRNAANSANMSVGSVLTNTNSLGQAINTTNVGTCNNYTLSNYDYAGIPQGTSGVTNGYWLYNNTVNGNACNNGYNYTFHYYCIEQ